MPNWYTINHPTTLHTHTMKPSDPLLLAYGTLRCGMYPAGKVAISQPSVTTLSASSVRTLVHCVVKYSRPPDLKSSSNVSLPFAWITGPATDPSYHCLVKTTLAEFMSVGNYLYKVPNGEKSACRNGFASNSSKRDLTLK